MKVVLIALSLFIISVGVFSQDKKAIFLVHSTGTDLFSQGKVSDWLKKYNAANSTNFQIYTRTYPENPWPWSNYPYDYWKLWIDNSCINSDPDIECLASLASKYDMVIFKHCYPGAGIESDLGKPDIKSSRKSLENYKLQYRALMDEMPDKKFMVWTLVPLHRLATNSTVSARANNFVNWVKTEWLSEDGKAHPNIFIFDFFSLAAEMNENPANGMQYCLRYDYEYSHTSSDSHPNTLANQTIGPLFAQSVVKALSNQKILVKTISINDNLNIDTIYGIGTKLSLKASVMPQNATNKTVEWAIENITGQASIDNDGLLITASQGLIKVIAKAMDKSNVQSEKEYMIAIPNKIQIIDDSFCFLVYPNPSNGKIQIHLDKIPSEDTILEIRNVVGQKLLEQKIYNTSSEVSFNKSIGSIYLVTLRGKNIFATKKIVF